MTAPTIATDDCDMRKDRTVRRRIGIIAGLLALTLCLPAAAQAAQGSARGAYLAYMHRLGAADGACLRAHGGVAEGVRWYRGDIGHGPDGTLKQDPRLQDLARRVLAACQSAVASVPASAALTADATFARAGAALSGYLQAVQFCALGWRELTQTGPELPNPPVYECPYALDQYAQVRRAYLALDRRYGAHAVTW